MGRWLRLRLLVPLAAALPVGAGCVFSIGGGKTVENPCESCEEARINSLEARVNSLEQRLGATSGPGLSDAQPPMLPASQ